MTVTMRPYLNFPGNAREAMTFYHSLFGGDLKISTFGEYSVPNMPADGVMHAELKSGSLVLFAADDGSGNTEVRTGGSIALILEGDEPEKLTEWFHALSEGGTVGMPLEKQMWGDVYGDLVDRFGIGWMVDYAAPKE